MKRKQQVEEALSLSARAEYRRFLCTERGARSYQRFQRALYGDTDSLVQEMFLRVLREMLGERSSVDLLDVGCGDGKRTAMICHEIEQSGKHFNKVEVIEQSPVFVQDIRARELSGELKAHIFAGRFESYSSEQRFDVVLALHSIFGMEGDDVMRRLLALRKSDGRVLVAANATGSLLDQLKRSLDVEYSAGRLEVGDVCEQLDSLGVAFRTERFFTKWSVPVGEEVEVEKLLSEWLGLGHFDTLDRSSQEEFHKVLWSNARSREGRIEWEEEEEFVIV